MNKDLNANEYESASSEARWKELERKIHKPITGKHNRRFVGITVAEQKWREDAVGRCVRVGMSVQHMLKFLPTWGLPLHRRQIYDYVNCQLKLPRRYVTDRQKMSTHDRRTLDVFVTIAYAAAMMGERCERIGKGTVEGRSKFRPDLRWDMGGRSFYMEMQISRLEEPRWRRKFTNYLGYYKMLRKPIHVLFVVSGDTDKKYARATCRQVLKDYGNVNLKNLFYFCEEKELVSESMEAIPDNAAADKIWSSAWDNRPQHSLLLLKTL